MQTKESINLELDLDPDIICEAVEHIDAKRHTLHNNDQACRGMLMEEPSFFRLDHSAICHFCKGRLLWQDHWDATQKKVLDWWSQPKPPKTCEIPSALGSKVTVAFLRLKFVPYLVQTCTVERYCRS